MNRALILCGIVFFLISSGCAAWIGPALSKGGENPVPSNISSRPLAAIAVRHAQAGTPGGKVLAAAVAMVDEQKRMKGACWDFVNAVYDRAGFDRSQREILYLQAETGPYADPGLIRPGDWVMYRNLPYGEIGHSAIFVEWIDFSKRSALTIEYVGNNRREPGQFREADLTKTWGILRGKK